MAWKIIWKHFVIEILPHHWKQEVSLNVFLLLWKLCRAIHVLIYFAYAKLVRNLLSTPILILFVALPLNNWLLHHNDIQFASSCFLPSTISFVIIFEWTHFKSKVGILHIVSWFGGSLLEHSLNRSLTIARDLKISMILAINRFFVQIEIASYRNYTTATSFNFLFYTFIYAGISYVKLNQSLE